MGLCFSYTLKPALGRLDSWKEIAAYLHRDVTTVQRWEKREGMPVHRHLHDKAGSVYAYSSELDAWQKSRKLQLEELTQEQKTEPPVETFGSRQRIFQSQSWLFLAGVVVVLLAAILIAMSGGHAKQPQIRSLAVLPLKNLSGDPTQDYLVDGMTEALISRLSRIQDLRVISRTSVMTFKDTKLPLPEIAKTLRVDAIVEGSVIRQGSRIRVHAQLIRGATDDHFWSEEYEREVRDALTLESDVAQAIARKVEVTLTGKERQRLSATHHVSPEVYESFLKAQDQANNINSSDDLDKAITDFEDTISKDPNFAPAYVGLASVYQLQTTSFASVPPQDARPKLISAARKALELDPDLVQPHILLGEVYQRQWQWSDAEAELKRALELSPNDARAQERFAIWLFFQNGQSLRLGDGRGQRLGKQVALFERGDNSLPALIQLGQARQSLPNRRYGHFIERARGFLAIASDERHRRPIGEQARGGGDLRRIDPQLLGYFSVIILVHEQKNGRLLYRIQPRV